MANEPGEFASPACLAHEMDDFDMGRIEVAPFKPGDNAYAARSN